jgi:hypothetical protein
LEESIQAAGMWSFWTGMADLEGSAMTEAFHDRVMRWQALMEGTIRLVISFGKQGPG